MWASPDSKYRYRVANTCTYLISSVPCQVKVPPTQQLEQAQVKAFFVLGLNPKRRDSHPRLTNVQNTETALWELWD
jgi:hypothetical protein